MKRNKKNYLPRNSLSTDKAFDYNDAVPGMTVPGACEAFPEDSATVTWTAMLNETKSDTIPDCVNRCDKEPPGNETTTWFNRTWDGSLSVGTHAIYRCNGN